jgi:hypothetical protein
MATHSCDFLSDAPAMPRTTFGVKGSRKVCRNDATHAIMYVPEDAPLIDHFGYLCDYHVEPFKEFIAATQGDPESYKVRKIRPTPPPSEGVSPERPPTQAGG